MRACGEDLVAILAAYFVRRIELYQRNVIAAASGEAFNF